MMEKVKKYWWAVLGAIGAVLAFVVAVVSRRKPIVAPDRPVLPDVKTPEAPKVEDKPADKYAEAAKKIDESKANDRVAAGNERYR